MKMLSLFKVIIVCTLCWLGQIVKPSVAQADSERVAQVEVDVPSFEPDSSVGLLVSSSGSIQKKISKTERSAHGTMLVSFQYLASEVKPDTMASAMLISKDGGIVMGNLRPVFADETKNSFLDIPKCPPTKLSGLIRAEQFGVLQNLIKYRVERRENTRLELHRQMSDKFLQSMVDYEAAFGLSRSAPLTPDLPPVQLIDRLSRLINSFRTYKAKPTPVPTEQPEATDEATVIDDAEEAQ